MGYSISVPIRSERLKNQMFTFLEEEYRPWADFDESYDGWTDFRGPLDRDLTFADGKWIIGFDYGSSAGTEREYVFALLRWVAIRVGRRRRRFKGFGDLRLPRPVPYWVYDGLESFPVILDDEWPKDILPPFRYDHLGITVSERLARELAWRHLPKGTFERITATHQNKPGDEIREAFIQAGLEGAKHTISVMRTEIARLDALWDGYAS